MKTTLTIITGLLSLLLLTTVIITIGYERHNSSKFNNTPLGITMEEIKADWGNPDEDFMDKNRHLIEYKKGIMGYSYLFEFEGKDTIVIAKYLDD